MDTKTYKNMHTISSDMDTHYYRQTYHTHTPTNISVTLSDITITFFYLLLAYISKTYLLELSYIDKAQRGSEVMPTALHFLP